MQDTDVISEGEGYSSTEIPVPKAQEDEVALEETEAAVALEEAEVAEEKPESEQADEKK
jgi:hypothetical protein